MALPEPLRGEVWDVRFPGFGPHPAVVLSVNPLNVRLGHVAVVPITGPSGPDSTHVALAADAKVSRYSESYADVTALQGVARGRLRRRRGLFSQGELGHLEDRLRIYLGLQLPADQDVGVPRPPAEPDPRRFYNERYVEDDRLRVSPHGRLEFVRTQELLRRHRPPQPARVLDVGGGTGVHARWLAADGYLVEVVDPVPAHVARAAAVPGVSARAGDARALDVPDEQVDAVLLLGPLYHLVDPPDRAAALAEARRVVRPGGLVAAAAISRYAGLLDFGARGALDERTEPLLREVVATGRHDPRLGFTTAYLHGPEELAAELRAAGLRDVRLYGVEGPVWPALDVAGLELVEQRLPAALAAARLVEEDPALLAASAHLLAVGYT